MTTESHTRTLKPILLTLGIVALLAIAFIGYTAWYVFIPHRYDPGTETTAADVEEYTGVSPPAEARELRVASFEAGQWRLALVRFKAPADVCRAYATKVLPGATLATVDHDQMYDDLTSIRAGSLRLQDLRWFDLPYATSLWRTEAGQAVFSEPAIEKVPQTSPIVGAQDNTERKSAYQSTSVRIDEAAGVFYCIRVN